MIHKINKHQTTLLNSLKTLPKKVKRDFAKTTGRNSGNCRVINNIKYVYVAAISQDKEIRKYSTYIGTAF
jgi:hypothetical protein